MLNIQHGLPDEERASRLLERIRETVTRPWVILELCGGRTHELFRGGFARLLPREIELLHGLGCPSCVTPLETLDRAHAIARLPDVVTTCGDDLLHLHGTEGDLVHLGARGADVRVLASPFDAVELARETPDRPVVFLGIDIEAAAPSHALALVHARRLGLRNFSMLVSHALVPPSVTALLQTPGHRVQALLGAGPSCVVTGTRPYGSIARRFRVPVVITGPTPVELLEGVWQAVRQLEAGRASVESRYSRPLTPEGDPVVKRLLGEVFEPVDRPWRGVGTLPASGYGIAAPWRDLDAEHVFLVDPLGPSGVPRAREAA